MSRPLRTSGFLCNALTTSANRDEARFRGHLIKQGLLFLYIRTSSSPHLRSVILQLVSHTKRPEKGRARKARNVGREVADHRFFDRESNSMVRQPISGVPRQRSQEAWHCLKIARIALPTFFVWETSCKIKCIRKAHFLSNPGW